MNPVTYSKVPPGNLEIGYSILFALLPWSVDIDFGPWNLSMPSEPLIALLGLGLAWEIARRPSRVSSPILIISLLWIIWMAVAAGFSSMKIVSLKYWLVEAGHWWVFGVGMVLWPGLWQRVLPYFILSMLGVVVYTMIHHSLYDFRADQAMLAAIPFFPDHTMYATVLALLFFFVQVPLASGTSRGHFLQRSGVIKGVAGFFLAALILSSSRAALVSVGVAGVVLIASLLHGKWRYGMLVVLLLGLCSYPMLEGKITSRLQRDVSTLERLNRWACAEEMLAAKPWTGYGPGTYSFQFIPFQQAEKMTRISIQTPLLERGPDVYGRGGGAHSEYWQTASELGWPGLLLWLLLVLSVVGTGGWLAAYAPSKPAKQLAWLITLGLLTFFLHGLVNNFLHDGRVAALVWGGIMVLGARKFQD